MEERMKVQYWGWKLVVFVILSVILCVVYFRVEVKAEDVAVSTVRIMIGEGTEARHHMGLAMDAVSDEFRFEVKGYEVKSSAYASSNPDVFTIQNTSEGRCRVQAVSQGTGYVTLTIRTKDGKKLTERIFVSVYETISACDAVTKRRADVYRGASDHADVENNDKKGELEKGETITLIAICDDYFRFARKEENIEPDGYYTGFVKMTDVAVPVISLMVEEELFFDLGEEGALDVEVEPELAPEPEFLYDSSSPEIAVIDEKGFIQTKRAGITVITVSTADGLHKAKCTVYVYSPGGAAWEDPGKEEGSTGNTTIQESSKKPKNKFDFQAYGYTDQSIRLTWKKQKKVKTYEIQRAVKKKGTYKTIKKLKSGKKNYLDKKVRFYKNYWYRLVVVKKNKKKLQSNPVKAKTKDSVVNLDLRVSGVKENSVELEWKKQKHVTGYVIQRRDVWERQEKFKKIGETGKKKLKFIDQTAKPAKKYEYRIIVKRTNNKDKSSNQVLAKTLFWYDNNSNISKFQKDYPFVCTDEKQDMNQYSVFGDYYSPIKYSYAKGTLTIHLYCEFVQYAPLGGYKYNRNVLYSSKDATIAKYYKIIKDNIKERYEVAIANRGNKEYEFRNMNFDIRVVFHEREDKREQYHNSQVFNEILIGGECPGCSEPGDHWYHQQETRNEEGECISRIYMPFISQLTDNRNEGARSIDDVHYAYISAHEAGHMLGLDDAYPTEEQHDRFTDNEETGVPESSVPGSYDNIMVERKRDKYLMPNDLEMMFQAYMNSKGKSWMYDFLQSYKTNEDVKIVISDCILNHFDHYNDTEGMAY